MVVLRGKECYLFTKGMREMSTVRDFHHTEVRGWEVMSQERAQLDLEVACPRGAPGSN